MTGNLKIKRHELKIVKIEFILSEDMKVVYGQATLKNGFVIKSRTYGVGENIALHKRDMQIEIDVSLDAIKQFSWSINSGRIALVDDDTSCNIERQITE